MLPEEDKYKPFFLRHEDFKNIYYDSDLSDLRKTVRHLDDVLKVMNLRFERSKTLTIAKSVFDYVTQKEMYFHYPHMYYDLRFGDVRICVGKKRFRGKNLYFVSCCGWRPVSKHFMDNSNELGYFPDEDVNKVLEGFAEIVRDFILTKLSSLF